ncbi:MAG: hypothetical protein WC695_01625 [Candidatus Omnitrophota bacterium]
MKLKSNKTVKIISLFLCFLLCFEQSGFAQAAAVELNIAGKLAGIRSHFVQESFRPMHLRSLSYDTLNNNFRLLLDKGNLKEPKTSQVEETTRQLLQYFFIGVSLPNDCFWVNLRPDSENNVIDPALAATDVGKILLESDLQLKKDTAHYTSPDNPQGKEYWSRLYKKAGEIFGSDNVTIPTLTRPWIIPDEIIIRESEDNAYIFKATLKVMLEQDYMKDSTEYSFEDERLKELNAYSSQLIRDLIIPALTKDINTSKKYASLRQVYYSLILAQWFKQKFSGRSASYSRLIDKRDLKGLTSEVAWSPIDYFKEYQRSFKNGEYNFHETVTTTSGQIIRSYFSGGVDFGVSHGQPDNPMANAVQRGLRYPAVYPVDVLAALPYALAVEVVPGGSGDELSVEKSSITIRKSLFDADNPEAGGTMGRWEYPRADLYDDGKLILFSAVRIPGKDGVVEEEFLSQGENSPRDITLQTRELSKEEKRRLAPLLLGLGISANTVRLIVREESSIKNRIYGAAVNGRLFLREDIIAKGTSDQIKEALDHEARELSRTHHDLIRHEQFRGGLRQLITRLSDEDKIDGLVYSADKRRVWKAIDTEVPVIDSSSQWEIRLYFLGQGLHLFMSMVASGDYSVYISNMGNNYQYPGYYYKGKNPGEEIVLNDDYDRKLLDSKVRALLNRHRNDEGINDFLKKVELNEAEKERMAALKKKYSTEVVVNEEDRASLLDELASLLDIDMEKWTPEEADTIQQHAAKLGYDPLYTAEKIHPDRWPKHPRDWNIKTIKQGDIIYIQYGIMSRDNTREVTSRVSGFVKEFPEFGNPMVIMSDGTKVNLNEVAEIIVNDGRGGHYSGNNGMDAYYFLIGGHLSKELLQGELPGVPSIVKNDLLKEMAAWPEISRHTYVTFVTRSEVTIDDAWVRMTGEKAVVLEAPGVQNNGVFIYKNASGRFAELDMADIRRIIHLGVDSEVAQLVTHQFKRGDRVVVKGEDKYYYGVVQDFYSKAFIGRRMIVKLDKPDNPEKPYVHVKFVNELETAVIDAKNEFSRMQVAVASGEMFGTINDRLAAIDRRFLARMGQSAAAINFWDDFSITYDALFGPQGLFEKEGFNNQALDSFLRSRFDATLGEMIGGITGQVRLEADNPLVLIGTLLNESEKETITRSYRDVVLGLGLFSGELPASTGTIPWIVKEKDLFMVRSGNIPNSDFTTTALLYYFDNDLYRAFEDKIILAAQIARAREKHALERELFRIYENREEVEDMSIAEREAAAVEYTRQLPDPDDKSAVRFVLGLSYRGAAASPIGMELTLQLRQELSSKQKIQLKQLLKFDPELTEPVPPLAAVGEEGLLVADRILKKHNAVGIVVGSVSKDLHNRLKKDADLKEHKDIDVVVLTKGVSLSAPFEGGIDWWLPEDVTVNTKTYKGSSENEQRTIYVNGNGVFLRCASIKDYGNLKPGLHLPSRDFLIDLTFDTSLSFVDESVEIDVDVETAFRERLERGIGRSMSAVWKKNFDGKLAEDLDVPDILESEIISAIMSQTPYVDIGDRYRQAQLLAKEAGAGARQAGSPVTGAGPNEGPQINTAPSREAASSPLKGDWTRAIMLKLYRNAGYVWDELIKSRSERMGSIEEQIVQEIKGMRDKGIESSRYFDDFGVANTDLAAQKVLFVYQRAINKFIEEAENIGLKITGLAGGMTGRNPRLGIYPKKLSYSDALKIYGRTQRKYPSDIDMCVEIYKTQEQRDRMQQVEREIYDEFGVCIGAIDDFDAVELDMWPIKIPPKEIRGRGLLRLKGIHRLENYEQILRFDLSAASSMISNDGPPNNKTLLSRRGFIIGGAALSLLFFVDPPGFGEVAAGLVPRNDAKTDTDIDIRYLSGLIQKAGWKVTVLSKRRWENNLNLKGYPYLEGAGIAFPAGRVIYYGGAIPSAGHLAHETIHVLQSGIHDEEILNTYVEIERLLSGTAAFKSLRKLHDIYIEIYNPHMTNAIKNSTELSDAEKEAALKIVAANETFSLIFGLLVAKNAQSKKMPFCMLNGDMVMDIIDGIRKLPAARKTMDEYYIKLGVEKNRVARLFFGEGDGVILAEIEVSQKSGSPVESGMGGIDGSAGSPSILRKDDMGGIDFRFLPMVTQAITNFTANMSGLSRGRLLKVDLTGEWQEIERVSSSGIDVCPQRLQEFTYAAYVQNASARYKDKIILCIARILRQEEDSCCETDPVLGDILVVLESIQEPQELSGIFLGTYPKL